MTVLNKTKKNLFAGTLLAFFALVGVGCGDRHKGSDSAAVPGGSKAAAVSVTHEEQKQTGSSSITLIPENPNVSDTLQAVISGDAREAAIRWMRNGAVIEGQTGAVLPAHSFLRGDTITVSVDSAAGEAWASTTILNSPPEVISVSFANPHAHCGDDIVAVPEGLDEDGDPVRFDYRWSINGEEFIANDSATLPGERFCKGDRIGLDVVPFDEYGEGKIFHGREFVIPNAPPVFTSMPPLQFKGRTYSYSPKAEDPDGDRLIFSLELGPAGMAIDPETGGVRWSVEPVTTGEYQIKIAVKDEEGAAAFQEYTLSLAYAEQEEK